MYIHPMIGVNAEEKIGGIFDLSEGRFVDTRISVPRGAEFLEWDEFRRRLAQMEKLRQDLGIPPMCYHAYGFRLDYSFPAVKNLIEWARAHDLEVRTWVNHDSGIVLVVVADPDTSADSGLDLYQMMQNQKKAGLDYRSYGLAAWWEFCEYGDPVFPDWSIHGNNGSLLLVSPDNRYVLRIGLP